MAEGWFEEAGEAQPVVATIVAHLAGQVRIGRRFSNGGDFADVTRFQPLNDYQTKQQVR
jgi:hypothetical protein